MQRRDFLAQGAAFGMPLEAALMQQNPPRYTGKPELQITDVQVFLVGAGIRNTNEIKPEWQELKVGDLVRLGRDESVIKLEVLAVEPGRYLVLPF